MPHTQRHIDPIMGHRLVKIEGVVHLLRITMTCVGRRRDNGGRFAIADTGQRKWQGVKIAAPLCDQVIIEIVARFALPDQYNA